MSTPPIFPQWPLAEVPGDPPKKTAWVLESPFSFVGGWEPLAFRRRAGYAWTDEERYVEAEEWSDAALARIREMGCNHLVLPFAKGYGRTANAEEAEGISDAAERARRAGLRVGTYIHVSNVMPELLVDEYPDVGSWLARDDAGQRYSYHVQQPARKRLCHSHRGAVAYVEDQIDHAIDALGCDLLHLDGFQLAGQPWSTCRCDECLASYRRWLKARYPTDADRRQRFGLVNFDRIMMPEFDAHAPLPRMMVSPDLQEFFTFQWDRLVALARHLRRYVRRRSDAVALSINPLLSNARNQHVYWCQWAEQVLPWVDAVWCEDPYHLRYENGRIVSRASVFKLAQEYGTAVCCYHWFADEPGVAASVALTTATNGGHGACLGFTHRFLPHYRLGEESKRTITRWAAEHWDLFRGATPAGETAMLRHQPSLAWNAGRPWGALVAMEQLLFAMKIPWRIVDRLEPSVLQTIRTLIQPDVECLSDEELAVLRTWVESGGRLVATTHTATHDHRRARRPVPAFQGWIAEDEASGMPESMSWYQWQRDDYVELEDDAELVADPPRVVPMGQGMLGLCSIVPGVPIRDAVNHVIAPDQLCPPHNADELARVLRDVNGPWEVQCNGPEDLVVHLTRTEPHQQLHLVRVAADATASDVDLIFRDPPEPQTLTVESPDAPLPRATFAAGGIRLSGLQRYAVIRINRGG